MNLSTIGYNRKDTLRLAVQNNPLKWYCIHIPQLLTFVNPSPFGRNLSNNNKFTKNGTSSNKIRQNSGCFGCSQY